MWGLSVPKVGSMFWLYGKSAMLQKCISTENWQIHIPTNTWHLNQPMACNRFPWAQIWCISTSSIRNWMNYVYVIQLWVMKRFRQCIIWIGGWTRGQPGLYDPCWHINQTRNILLVFLIIQKLAHGTQSICPHDTCWDWDGFNKLTFTSSDYHYHIAWCYNRIIE